MTGVPPATLLEERYVAARRRGEDPATALAERMASNAEARNLRRQVGLHRAHELDDQVRDELLVRLGAVPWPRRSSENSRP